MFTRASTTAKGGPEDGVLDPSRVRVSDLAELQDGELLFVFLLSHKLVLVLVLVHQLVQD